MFETDKESILAMPRLTLGLWLSAFVVACTIATAWWAPDGWGPVRIVVGGVLMGVMSFFMLFINRLLVS